MKNIVALILGVLLFTSSYVHAGLITYTDRTAFQNDTGSLISFEGFNGSFDTSLLVTAANGYDDSFWTGYQTEGTHSLGLVETSAVTFTLSQPTYAFGFDVSNLHLPSIGYSDSAGHSLPSVISMDEGDQFFGVISDVMISSFTLGSGSYGTGPVYFVDAFEVRSSAAVPEPVSLALFGLGLAGIGFSRKKKAA